MELDSMFPGGTGADAEGLTWPLVVRYCSGEATADEIEGIHRWIGTDLTRQREIEFLRGVWAQSGVVIPPHDVGDVERVLGRLAQRMREAERSGTVDRTPVMGARVSGPHRIDARGLRGVGFAGPTGAGRWRMVQRIGVAAALLLMIAGGVSLARMGGGAGTAATATTYITHNGQRAELQLGDGTRVTLNVGSRIDVPADFTRGDRVVRLSGEGDFRVAHTAGAPFVVEAAGTRTRVLGTEFGVRAYRAAGALGDAGAADAMVRVVVREGRVSVGRTVLQAGDIGRVAADGRVQVAHGQPVDAALGFVVGKLVIEHLPLREAIGMLDRWYDVDVRLGDPSLGDVPMHAVLGSGSAGDLAEILRVTFDATVVRQGRTLTLFRE